MLLKLNLYDAEGRLCATENLAGAITGYIYNADGTRVAKGTLSSFTCPSSGFNTLTHQYLLDQGGDQVTELDGSNNWLHSNVFAAGQLLGTYDSSSGTPALNFQLSDWLGTRRVEASSTGVVLETCYNLPFGNGAANCTTPTEQFYTAKERDTESGNDYFGARYFGSTVGRFISPDPSGLNYAHPTNPQSLNLYSYVQNNPLINTDPTGMDCVLDNGDETVTTMEGDCDNSTTERANNEYYIDCDGCTSGASGATLDSATGSLLLTDSNGNALTDQNGNSVAVQGFSDPQGTPPTTVTVNGSNPSLDTISGWGVTPPNINAPNNANPQNQNNGIYSMDQDARIKALAIGITNDSNCATSALAQGYANIAQDAVPVPLAVSAGVGELAGKFVTVVSIAADIWNAAGAYAKCF